LPSIVEHEKQHLLNQNAINQLITLQTPPYDWIVTIYFYSIVHHIEGKLAKYDYHTRDHGERNHHVKTLFAKINIYYQALYTESQNARYDCVDMTKGKAAVAKSNYEQIIKLIK
jgi:hypothetical protein